MALLAALAPDLTDALAAAGDGEILLVDGTVIVTDRVASKGFGPGNITARGEHSNRRGPVRTSAVVLGRAGQVDP